MKMHAAAPGAAGINFIQRHTVASGAKLLSGEAKTYSSCPDSSTGDASLKRLTLQSCPSAVRARRIASTPKAVLPVQDS